MTVAIGAGATVAPAGPWVTDGNGKLTLTVTGSEVGDLYIDR